MTPLTDAELDGLQERLEKLPWHRVTTADHRKAADAIRSLRAERDAYRSNADRALEVIKQFRDERDALRTERDALRNVLIRLANIEAQFWNPAQAKCLIDIAREAIGAAMREGE